MKPFIIRLSLFLLLKGDFSHGGNSHIFGGQQSGGNWSKVRGAFVKGGDRRCLFLRARDKGLVWRP